MKMILALSAILAAPGEAAPTLGPVAPAVGESVVMLARFDLVTPAPTRAILGATADAPRIAALIGAFEAGAAALRKLGVVEVYAIAGPGDLPPAWPVLAAPLPAGSGEAEGRAISEALRLAWPGRGDAAAGPAVEARVVRGVALVGLADSLARIESEGPVDRPDLAAAFADGGPGPARVALAPGRAFRRAIEESTASLPDALGGGPVETLTRGLVWASARIGAGPRAVVRVAAEASRPDQADAIAAILGRLPIGGDAPNVAGTRIVLDLPAGPALAAMIRPAARGLEAQDRSMAANHLKRICLALHNYHSAHDAFPPAYTADKDGRPLLSWRVLILPHLDEKDLYDRFRLDEPWDGPNNKALIGRMPAVFGVPAAAPGLLAAGRTTFLSPRGEMTVFDGPKGVPVRSITDGTSNTIIAIEAADALAVTWSRPDDWPVGPDAAIAPLIGHYADGTNAAFADGSVRFLNKGTSAALFRKLLTRNGGEVISADEL